MYGMKSYYDLPEEPADPLQQLSSYHHFGAYRKPLFPTKDYQMLDLKLNHATAVITGLSG